jgi:hypothetical protein
MDGAIDSGPDAVPDSGHDAGSVVSDSGPDATMDTGMPGDEPEPPASGCGPNHGFFADVARPLTKTADGVSCVTFAQNRLDEKLDSDTPTLEHSTAMLHELIDKALDAELDVIELYVSQEPTPADPGDAEVSPASLLHATGRYGLTTLDPLLGETLDYQPLRESNRPLRLLVTNQIASADELAYALLSLLLDKQASAAGGYATECRPVYIMADTDPGKISLVTMQMVLANDPMFASLRGHIHFGGHTATYRSAQNARDEIDVYESVGFEFVDVEYSHPSLIPLVRYAREKGLQVFARETLDIGLPATLCGLVDGLATPFVSYNSGPAFRIGISSSRTLVALDVADLAADAHAVSYSVPPVGTTEQSALGAGTPTLVSGALKDALPGTALAFAAGANQSLALNDPALPQGQKLAVLAVLQLNPGALSSAGPAVIASKRQGSTGWALELVDVGAGAKEVRFDAFVRFPDDSVHVSQVGISADAFDPLEIQHVLVGFNQHGTYLRFRGAPEIYHDDADFGFTIVDNDAPITLGSDPGAVTGSFDGKLQLLKVISYTY